MDKLELYKVKYDIAVRTNCESFENVLKNKVLLNELVTNVSNDLDKELCLLGYCKADFVSYEVMQTDVIKLLKSKYDKYFKLLQDTNSELMSNYKKEYLKYRGELRTKKYKIVKEGE